MPVTMTSALPRSDSLSSDFPDASSKKLPGWQIALLIVAAMIVADLSFRIRPTNYFGGSTDDQRYVEAALSWLIHGPHAGTTHWSLRHPLVLSVAASFKAFGISIASVQLVPRLYADLLVGLTTGCLARFATRRAAGLWLLLALTSPILHEMATSCFPEMLELTFGAASMWLFWVGCKGKAGLLFGSGLLLGLATLTRETAICLLPIYVWAWWREGRSVPLAAAFLAGFVPPIAIDTLWLWSITGDLLYRLHVDQSHIGIYSDHLRGGVYHGRAFLNPDLASRWVPSGPISVHWTIDPVLDFVLDPRFALIFVAWGVLWAARATRPSPGSATGRAMPMLLAVTVAAYVIVTWILTLRPQPRYYLFAVYAATLAVALIAARAPRTTIAARLRAGLLGLVVLSGVVTISLSPDRQRDARVILPWLKAHPGYTLYLDPKEAGRLAFPAALAGINRQIGAGAPPVGGLRLLVPRSPGAPPVDTTDPRVWQEVETLTQNRLFPYVNAPRRLVVQRRIR